MKLCITCNKECKNKYCSFICQGAHQGPLRRRQNVENYNNNPNRCPNCNISIDYDKRHSNVFCSHSCAAIQNNKKFPKRKSNRHCLMCNKKLIGNQQKYCSNECRSIFRQEKTKTSIESGFKLNVLTIKKYLIEERTHQCESCKLTEWLGQIIPIEMDHIDGQSENNSLSNLRLICPNCHALTPTYKNKNKGNGRHKRRERYAEGKSY